VRLSDARRFALSLPETTEEPHFAAASWRVKGKIFCTVPDPTFLHVLVDPDERLALIEEDPAVFEEIVWGKRVVPEWVRVHLPKASTPQVKELLEDGWRRKAPKRVLAAFDASRQP
jgi:hypothetical protein